MIKRMIKQARQLNERERIEHKIQRLVLPPIQQLSPIPASENGDFGSTAGSTAPARAGRLLTAYGYSP